jgi:hypothetical protein
MNSQTIPNKNTRLFLILSAAALVLSLPLIAMMFTNEVDWKLPDFIIMGILLFSTGLGIELVLRKVKGTLQRMLFCGAILLVLFLIWAELAVGIFGTPFAGS